MSKQKNDVRDLPSLGDRMKGYELLEAGRKAMPRLPLVARLDGRAFHTFTRGMARPYDPAFSTCMVNTMRRLVEAFHVTIGYTQSDEISLYFEASDEFIFDGRYQKLHSVLASAATAYFIREYDQRFADKSADERESIVPQFDCRVWQLPDEGEVMNMLIWREDDAAKNSVSMLAQSQFSTKQLHKKNTKNMIEMLETVGIYWAQQPIFFKRGTYAARRVVERTLSPQELERIPEKYRPEGPVQRGEVAIIDLPPIREAHANMPSIKAWLPSYGARKFDAKDGSTPIKTPTKVTDEA